MQFSASLATATLPSAATLEERAARQVDTYWRVRIRKTLERLESEARRVLQLEQEIGEFSRSYYEAVGSAAERLAALEEKIAKAQAEIEPALTSEEAVPEDSKPSPALAASTLAELPVLRAQCDMRVARQRELKSRYRNLAKEIHPDRAMIVEGASANAAYMHTLNAAYQHGDLAKLLKLEAEILLQTIAQEEGATTPTIGKLERALREVEQAADTYANAYRQLLHSPINELMLRAMAARLAGWDWVDTVVRRLERTIEEKERAAVLANISAISQWRACAQEVA